MHKKINLQANYNITTAKNKGNISISVELYSFIEDKIHYVYCPQLDLYGYGKTEKESHESFKVNLDVFLNYTLNKKTLGTELKRLGWKHSKKK